MSHQPEDSCWGKQPDDIRHSQDTLIGKREGPTGDYFAMGILEKAKLIKVSARQLIATLRGGHGIGETPNYPEDIQGVPPKKINGYTDGGG